MYSIHELAAMFNLPRRTIRYYVERGVLPRPAGTVGANRRWAYYTDEHVRILRLVRREVHDRVTLADLAERRLIQEESRA